MAAMHATLYPVYGQEFRFAVCFYDNSGNLLSGWTGATATVYVDNGAGTMATIAESPANSGVGYVDLTAAQVSGYMITVKSTITNANAMVDITEVKPVFLVERQNAWDEQSVVRFEDVLLNVAAALINQNQIIDGVNTILTRAGLPMLTGNVIQGSSEATRSKLT